MIDEPSVNILRILVAGSSELDRRLRMTSKVIHELRKRQIEHSFIVAGPAPDAFLRDSNPDQYFPELLPDETARLILSCSLCLETGRDEPVTPLAALCETAGMPVLVHASALMPISSHRFIVNEYSADAFVDAIMRRPLWTAKPGSFHAIANAATEAFPVD